MTPYSLSDILAMNADAIPEWANGLPESAFVEYYDLLYRFDENLSKLSDYLNDGFTHAFDDSVTGSVVYVSRSALMGKKS